MRGHKFAIVGIAALFACALIAAGCGGDDSTSSSTSTSTSTSAGDNATQSVDAAVKSCTDQAQQIGGVAGTALSGACTSVGAAATQAVATAGDSAQQALSQAASSCQSSVSQVPKGQAQDALTQLCDAIAAAGSG
jgi:hypothetical protein